MYLAREVAMSLSKFYKKSQNFQPDTLVPKGNSPKDEPVWGESLITEEIEIELPDTSEVHEEVAPVVEETPVEPVEVLVEEVVSTPPAAKPDFDLEAIRNEAFASGVDMGRKEAEEDFGNGINTLLSICNELDKLRETILKNSIPEMKELVINISEKVIRHSITQQEETITATIREAIQLAVKSDEIQIQINPDDLKCIEAQETGNY